MFRAIITTILAVLMSGCAWFYIPADKPRPLSTWFTFPTDEQLRDYARNHDPVPVSEAEAQAHYNLLNNPPPGCEDDLGCKSDQVWSTHRVGEYERARLKREKQMGLNYDPMAPSEAEAQAHYNLLNNPPPGCEDDPRCKSNQVWATYRVREYERAHQKREARERCMRELYSERRARLGIPQCTGGRYGP